MSTTSVCVEPSTPLPGSPKLPTNTGNAKMARQAAPPLALRSCPQPMRSNVGVVSAHQFANVAMASGSIPHTSAAASSDQADAAARNSSAPSACVAMNSAARAPVLAQWLASARASTTSVPGRTGRCRSARFAIGVRRGSITTNRAPPRTASWMSGARCEFDTVGLAPHTTMSFAAAMWAGSADAIPGNTLSHAAPTVAAQMVGSTTVEPRAAKSASVRLSPSIRPDDELYVKATTASGPAARTALVMRSATSAMASSHDAARNSPLPLVPVRTNGVSTRSGAYTRSAWRFTLAQIHPWVNG